MDRNLACKTCGTKVFKSPGEVDDHHVADHPEAESKPGENHVEADTDEVKQEDDNQ